MSYMNCGAALAIAGGIQELNFDELDIVSGASELGDNVLKFAGAGAAVGFAGGPKGAAIGTLIGAAVGVAVTLLDD